jgi:hypothetical protein
MQLKKQAITDRKADTRKKIMLGGLFVKAGLDDFYPNDPATLYGMLLDAKEQIATNPSIKDKWRELGRELIKH